MSVHVSLICESTLNAARRVMVDGILQSLQIEVSFRAGYSELLVGGIKQVIP